MRCLRRSVDGGQVAIVCRRASGKILQIVVDSYDRCGIGKGRLKFGLRARCFVLDDMVENSGGCGEWRKRTPLVVIETCMKSMQNRKAENQENSGVMFLRNTSKTNNFFLYFFKFFRNFTLKQIFKLLQQFVCFVVALN